MNKKTIILMSVILLVLSFAGGLLTGRYLEQKKSGQQDEPMNMTVFYAEVEIVDESSLLVSGLDINDINFRGRFYLSVDQQTPVLWRYTDISLEDLSPGAVVSVAFTGSVLESEPAQIREVLSITLLDDDY